MTPIDDELDRRRRERAAAVEPALDGLGTSAWSPRFPAAVLLATADPVLGDFTGLTLRARAVYVVLSCLGPRRDLVDRADLQAAAPELTDAELDELLTELHARGLLGPQPEPPPTAAEPPWDPPPRSA